MAAPAGALKPFYIALGLIAVIGGVLIVTRMGGSAPAPLSLDTVAPLATGPRGIVIGSDSAPVEVVEYSDFECPWCARFAIIQMPDVKQRLVETGRVRWRFVHFPLNGHLKAPEAHLAAACANRQGRFWPYHDVVYQNQDEWVASRRPAGVLATYAQRVGLDMTAFDQCVNQREAWGDVLADKALGDRVGIGGTPTFYINGRLFDEPQGMSVDRLQQIVDSIAPPPSAGTRD